MDLQYSLSLYFFLALDRISYRTNFQNLLISFAYLVFCLLIIWLIWGLFGFHIFLMITNLTTNEFLKKTFEDKQTIIENPFNQGSLLKNCLEINCKSRPTTLLLTSIDELSRATISSSTSSSDKTYSLHRKDSAKKSFENTRPS